MSRVLRACVVSQRAYPGDARLTNQIDALKDLGYTVDVIATRSANKPNFSVESGVRIYRPPSVERKRMSKVRYVLEYISFLLSAFFVLSWLHLRHRYQLVLVTNLPDGLVFSAAFAKLLGAKILFDLRETTPEMFMDRYGANETSRAIRLMAWIEQVCIRFVDGVTACTEQQKQAVAARGADPEKISVMLNVGLPDLQLEPILPNPAEDTSREFRIITHGTIIKRYGLETLIRAMPLVIEKIPQARLEIVGRGEQKSELEALVAELKMGEIIRFAGFVPDAELIKKLRAAHIGAVPLNRNPESNLIHTFKMFEYIALGIPVVITRTAATEAYFKPESMYFFDSGSHEQMAGAIIDLAQHPEKRLSLAKNALAQFEQYSPLTQKAAFQLATERLVPIDRTYRPLQTA